MSVFIKKDSSLIYLIRIIFVLLIVVYILFRILDTFDLFIETIDCGAEQVETNEKNSFYVANGNAFDNAYYQSTEKIFEGKYSIKLDPTTPFGFSITFDVPLSGDKFEASVWAYSDSVGRDNGFFSLVATSGDKFWICSTDVLEEKNGWKKLSINFVMPDKIYNDPIVFYCWNNSKGVVYFDNLQIKKKNYWKYFKI